MLSASAAILWQRDSKHCNEVTSLVNLLSPVCGKKGFIQGRVGDPCKYMQAPVIGDAFFKALAKVRSIHANCIVLLRTHHQRAGLEIMDAMSAHQEAAYERLCR